MTQENQNKIKFIKKLKTELKNKLTFVHFKIFLVSHPLPLRVSCDILL